MSVIKNSAEDVSDERAIDAFLAGLHRSDLVEEIGRTRPRTMSELMEIANRFADGEDAYNNKRGHSIEVDKTSRKRRRYLNSNNYGRQNQITAGYEEGTRKAMKTKSFKREIVEEKRNQGTRVLRHKTCYMVLVASIMRT
jgi:hypothetical protein